MIIIKSQKMFKLKSQDQSIREIGFQDSLVRTKSNLGVRHVVMCDSEEDEI